MCERGGEQCGTYPLMGRFVTVNAALSKVPELSGCEVGTLLKHLYIVGTTHSPTSFLSVKDTCEQAGDICVFLLNKKSKIYDIIVLQYQE